MLPDSALRNDSYPDEFEHSSTPDRLNLLWAGKLLRWKGLDLALIAMKDLGVKARVHLTVAGDGPLTRDFESTVKRLGLRDIVTFRGRVPWLEMSKEFLRADAFLFTSLRDSFGSVALEATSYGLPIVTLDIGGAGTFLPAGAAIKIKPSSVKGTASALAGAILRLRDDPSLRHGMGLAARRFAESMSWEQHAAIMWQIYQGVSGVPDGLRISAQNESPHNSQ
jgi:glycosyltransferase involved in cell wall biosynthesis